ncbi:hypothetical protein JNJ66_01750 [Candidatus Saccharibacteria bacterium]|nr:hypothetical protein [Candidatus Saccharibacteria bacterium]
MDTPLYDDVTRLMEERASSSEQRPTWIFREGPLQILLMMAVAFVSSWMMFYGATAVRITRVLGGEPMDALLLPPSLPGYGGAVVMGWIFALAATFMVPIIRLAWAKAEPLQRTMMLLSIAVFVLVIQPGIAFL